MPMEQERKINHNNIVECKNVSKTFITPEGEHPVVQNLDLEARENEFLVLLPSQIPPGELCFSQLHYFPG